MTEGPPLLEMRGIGKRFIGVTALDGVSLSLHAGEVLALMGENGAGKSTLMKVLGGLHQPDSGEIRIDGQPVALDSVARAQELGIALIHQELMLAPNLDIAANLFLGREWGSRERSKRWASYLTPLPKRQLRERSQRLLERVGLSVPASTPVARLTPGQRQLCEIAKALGQNARILIMDEPTSSLTAGESEQLFRIIAQLKAGQIGVIYISHRMDEVRALADRVTVLRDARHVGDLTREQATHEQIVSLMVGRQLSGQYFPDRAPPAEREPGLDVEDLVVPGAPGGVSFQAYRGQILGFAGLVGSGRTELMQAIFGATRPLSGSMRLGGAPFRAETPRQAIRRGVFLAPEDRKSQGLVLPMSVAENTSLPDIGSYARLGWLDRKRERRVAEQEMKRLNTKATGPEQRVVNLSGGNQQKVVLGKWLAMSPRVLILDEPTRGIDVGAKAEIYRHMAALAESGVCVLMVSSDMEEILGMSDRVAVMHERRLVRVLEREELSQQHLAHLMTGGASVEAAR